MIRGSRFAPLAAYFSHHRTSRSRLSLILRLIVFTALLASISSCGKGKKNSLPTNVGGGFTLVVSGGILNDGSGVNGLAVLATLRDSEGWGPTQVWTISITGPDIPSDYPLIVEYSDQRRGSYMSWEWEGFDPLPGTYRATATNGFTTMYYDYTVTTATLSRPAPNATSSGNTITLSWPAVPGAGSYSYEVCSSNWDCMNGMTITTSETVSFGTLSTGDYLVQVRAYATDRIALSADHSSFPGMASQEKISEYIFSFPVGGDQTSSHYSLSAAGGVLDFGLRAPGNIPVPGIAFWTSIQDVTSPGNPAPPAGNWNIKITDPNGIELNYIYPANERHDAMWYYAIEPVIGSYTVTATYGTAVKTASFSLADTTPKLTPLSYADISASLVSNATNTSLKDISINWPAVSGAKSYYVSLYAEVWDKFTKQYEYDEVWGRWVSSTNARVLNGDIASGLACDVYVTAYEVDMTTIAPPATPPSRADMSENYYGYPLPFSTP